MGLFLYVNAVLREITKLLPIRDRSVVTSSVIPSAKYCWSGSLLRLANGRTTIDRRGAARGCAMVVVVATAGVGEDFAVGQTHHAPPAAIRTAATAAAAIARRLAGRRVAANGTPVAGSSAMASGRSA